VSYTDAHVLLESDPARLARLRGGLTRAGIPTVAVAHIAELERWPSNRCIIADVDRVSRWWTDVGALGVIALAKTRGEGIAACERGAATWLLRDCSIPRLVAALKTICSSRKRRNATSDRQAAAADKPGKRHRRLVN